jgi:two-component system, LytTR family, response regulator
MTSLSVLVVDDEPLARQRIMRHLRRLDWIGPVEEAGNIDEASKCVLERRPDILLLDIQMPGGDGFELLARLDEAPAALVFITAFDHHALRAFEASAVDYVTKPIEPGRFLKAMERARLTAQGRSHADQIGELQETVASLKSALASQATRKVEFWVKKHGGFVRIVPEQVIRFQGERDYVRLHVDGADFLYNESLASLESRLDPADFFRIHRSTIVRRDAITTIKGGPFASLVMFLIDGSEVRVGRTYTTTVRANLARGR